MVVLVLVPCELLSHLCSPFHFIHMGFYLFIFTF